jgi:hypothetical protein
MSRLFIALLIVVSSAVYSVATDTTAGSRRGTFRVATFNIYKGAGGDNRYDLERTIEAIARLDADVVGLQEALRNHPQFNCDDQPALIADGLSRLTGRRWAHVYAKAWITDDRECLGRGRGDDVATEGVALLTPERVLATSQINLPESRVGLMARLASMPDVPVIVTFSFPLEGRADGFRHILDPALGDLALEVAVDHAVTVHHVTVVARADVGGKDYKPLRREHAHRPVKTAGGIVFVRDEPVGDRARPRVGFAVEKELARP